MYGRSCIGLVIDNPFEITIRLYRFLVEQAGWQPRVAQMLIESTQQDSMGYSAILYWPNWTIAEDDADMFRLAEVG
jgi:hypothetical protein